MRKGNRKKAIKKKFIKKAIRKEGISDVIYIDTVAEAMSRKICEHLSELDKVEIEALPQEQCPNEKVILEYSASKEDIKVAMEKTQIFKSKIKVFINEKELPELDIILKKLTELEKTYPDIETIIRIGCN